MQNLDDRKWNFIRGILNSLQNEKESEIFEAALTCTRNPALLEKYLYKYLVEVKPPVSQVIIKIKTIVKLVCQNPIGYDVLYNFLWTFMEKLKIR